MGNIKFTPKGVIQGQSSALIINALKDLFKHPNRIAYRSEQLRPYDIGVISSIFATAILLVTTGSIIGYFSAGLLTLVGSLLVVKQIHLVYTGHYGTFSLELCFKELTHANQVANANNDQAAKELIETAKIAYLEGRDALAEMNRNGQDRYANGLITFQKAPDRQRLPLVRKASLSLSMVYDAVEEIISQNSNVTSLTAARINKQLDAYKTQKAG